MQNYFQLKDFCRFEACHTDYINCVGVSENGIIISGSGDKTVKVFDISARKEMHHFSDAHTSCLTDPKTSNQFEFPAIDIDWVLGVAISSKGDIAVSSSADRSINIYDIPNKKISFSFQNVHGASIRCVDISRDGKLMVSGSDDKTIKIFDTLEKKILYTFESVHEDFVYAVRISNDSAYLASGSGDKSIKVFSIANKTQIHHFKNAHEDIVLTLDLCNDNKKIVSGSRDKSVRVFDIEAKQQISEFPLAHSGYVRAVRFSSDGNVIASASRDMSIKLFSLEEIRTVQIIPEAHSDAIWSLSWSSNDKYVVTGGGDKCIRVFSFYNGRLDDLSAELKDIVTARSSFSDDIFAALKQEYTLFQSIEINAKTSTEYISQIEQKFQLKKKAIVEKNYKAARNSSKQIDQFQKEISSQTEEYLKFLLDLFSKEESMQGLEANLQGQLTEYKEVLKQQQPLIKEKFTSSKKKVLAPKQLLGVLNEEMKKLLFQTSQNFFALSKKEMTPNHVEAVLALFDDERHKFTTKYHNYQEIVDEITSNEQTIAVADKLYTLIHDNHKKVSELIKSIKFIRNAREDIISTLTPLVQDQLKSLREQEKLKVKSQGLEKEIKELQDQAFDDATKSNGKVPTIEEQQIKELEEIENFKLLEDIHALKGELGKATQGQDPLRETIAQKFKDYHYLKYCLDEETKHWTSLRETLSGVLRQFFVFKRDEISVLQKIFEAVGDTDAQYLLQVTLERLNSSVTK